MRKLLLLLTIVALGGCANQEPSSATIIKREALHDLMAATTNQDVKVLNFWATWCAPCIEEMPAFEAVNEDNIEVIFISLDDASKLEDQVNTFLRENNIVSRVVLLDDPYANEWVPMVDSHWDGAIPATLIIKGDKKRFFNQTFNEDELREAINTL
ncbi:TlpA family protein disulfide reductase [Nonlabens ponticola]|nr:TlpA disulfide reductase family protein [Nonlabens ponticola]